MWLKLIKDFMSDRSIKTTNTVHARVMFYFLTSNHTFSTVASKGLCNGAHLF